MEVLAVTLLWIGALAVIQWRRGVRGEPLISQLVVSATQDRGTLAITTFLLGALFGHFFL